jgi:HopA1 effector protein family
MTDYRVLVAEAVAATEVVTPTSHAWFGVRSQALPDETATLMSEENTRAYLLYHLQARLYADFYCAGRARPPFDEPTLSQPPSGGWFVQELSAANAGRFAREPGWTVVREERDATVVTRGGLTLWVPPAEVHSTHGRGVSPGTDVVVLMPKELLRLSPGFYMALGEAEFAMDAGAPVNRFYWNLRREGAVSLVRCLTHALNARELAFRLKVVNDPAGYSRCDAGVLYTLKEEYDEVSSVVSEAYASLAGELKPATPALTRELAPGLGFAEDPGSALTSFGMDRCQLLAEGIVRAAELGAREPEQRMAVVEQRFSEAGLDLDAPYLNPQSADSYAFAPA